jgi:predicted AAA+ superfamily ATPase
VDSSSGLVKRQITPTILERLRASPVVLLEGPRSVGKTTLLRELARTLDGEVVDLDHPGVRQAISASPSAIAGRGRLVCIDEYQRVPAVLDTIKAQLNESSAPGQFLLAGSTRHAGLPPGAQALTGRLIRTVILPLAQCELEGTAPGLVGKLFRGAKEARRDAGTAGTSRTGYAERVIRGGFPLALARQGAAERADWFESYIDLTLDRDIKELGRLRRGWALPELVRLLSSQTAGVLDVARAAAALGLKKDTALEYVRALENAFLISRLPAWRTARVPRAQARPKVQFVDSGVAAHCMGLSAAALGALDPGALTAFGPLFETFAVGEVTKQVAWTRGTRVAGHWRFNQQVEVDLVLEDMAGRVVAFEVKAASSLGPRAFAGLRRLRDALGDTFAAGVVLYTGPMPFTKEDRLVALPLDALWTQPA